MKSLLLFMSFLILSGCASNKSLTEKNKSDYDDREQVLEDMCKLVTCQYNVRIQLKKEDGSKYDQTFEAMPVIQENGVMVYGGHTLYFEADIEGDLLVDFKWVQSIVNPNKTVSATLQQMDDGGMMLALKNPFDKPLKFSMGIMPLDREELYSTSSCPVMAKGGSYEMWPYPIFQVWLASPRLLSENDSMSCEN